MGWYVFLFTLQASNLLALLFLGKNSWSFWLSLISRTSRAPCLGFECLWLLAKCAHQRLTSRMVSADSSHLLTLPSWNRKPCWTRSSRLRSCWGKAMSFCKHLHWHWTSRHTPWPGTSPDLACFSWTKKAKGRKGKNIQAWPTSLMLSLLNALKWSNMDIWGTLDLIFSRTRQFYLVTTPHHTNRARPKVLVRWQCRGTYNPW